MLQFSSLSHLSEFGYFFWFPQILFLSLSACKCIVMIVAWIYIALFKLLKSPHIEAIIHLHCKLHCCCVLHNMTKKIRKYMNKHNNNQKLTKIMNKGWEKCNQLLLLNCMTSPYSYQTKTTTWTNLPITIFCNIQWYMLLEEKKDVCCKLWIVNKSRWE